MSVENLKKFGMLCAENEDVRKRAKEIGLNDFEGLMAYGREMNLDFSREDLATLAKDAGVSRQELSEEQLEQVAGGIYTMTVVAPLLLVVGAYVVGAVTAAVGTSDDW